MAQPETTPKTVDASMNSVFLEKVGEIPVVSAAKEYSTAAYNHVKQMSSITNLTLSKAESTILFLALTVKPFLDKVQPQAKIVDDMACRTLEVVEAKAPFIMKSPEELVDDARNLCLSTVGTSIQKVEEIKARSSDAISSVKNFGLQKANDCLSGTENLIDRYLPPAFGEGSAQTTPETQSLKERATHLTTKVGQRVYGHGVKQFINMQQLSQESIAKLAYTVELMQHIKDNYAGKSVQDYVDEAKVKANWVWEELNKEQPAVSEDAEKTLEQRLLFLARRLTSTLVHTYSSTPISDLPQKCLDGVNAASVYAAELFTQFDQATNAGEVASTVLLKVRGTIEALEGVVKTVVDNAQKKDKENIEMDDLVPNQPSPSSG